MALARVQASAVGRQINSSSIAFSMATPPTLGNGLVVVVNFWRPSPFTALPGTCIDSYGNVYTLVATQGTTVAVTGLFVCAAVTATGSSFTITVTSTPTTLVYWVAQAIEVSGVGTGLWLDQATGSTSASGTALTTTATAPLTDADVFQVAACAISAAQGSITVGAATPTWTQEFEELPFTYIAGEADSRVVTSAAGTTPSCTWTDTASTPWAAVLAAFRANGPAPPARLARVQATPIATGATSAACTFAAPPTIGNGLLVGVLLAGTTTTTCTDNQGNVYTLALSQPGAINTEAVRIYYCRRITATGSPFTITVAAGASAFMVAGAVEISGVGGGLAVDVATGTGGISAAPQVQTTAATLGDRCALALTAITATQSAISVARVASDASVPGWTQEIEQLVQSPSQAGEIDSRVFLASGVVVGAQWTGTASGWYAAGLAIFKATVAPVSPPAPIAYWPFNEATGTTAADATGNGHTATLVSGTWDTSGLKKFGAAALANSGVGRGADFTGINLGTVHSVAFWMNGWDGSNDGVIIGGADTFYAAYIDNTSIYYSCGTGSFKSVTHGGLTGSHHVVVTRNGVVLTWYKDGVLLGSQTLTTGSANALLLTAISNYGAGAPTGGFAGTLDEVRFYDVALTAAQVAGLFALDPGAPVAVTTAQTYIWGPL